MKLYIPPHDLVRYWWKTRKHFHESSSIDVRETTSRCLQSTDGELPAANPYGVFFTACDSIYFDLYAENYVASIGASRGRQSVHLHVYDGDETQLARARRLGVRHDVRVTASRDTHGAPELYSAYFFAAGRFVLLPRLIEASGSPVVCTDIDVLVRRSLDQSVSQLAGQDASLHLRPDSSLPWRKVLASVVIGMPTPASIHYFNSVATTLSEILATPLGHHVDQIILYLAYRHARTEGTHQMRVAKMHKCMVDWDFDESSLVWNAKGPQRKDAYWAAARAAGLVATGCAE